MKVLLLFLSLALNPEQSARHEGVVVRWRENRCEGFGPGDCSVRQPQTANVQVEFADRTARLLVRCKTVGCVADAAEVAEWVRRAKETK